MSALDTSLGLLGRVQSGDAVAWEAFSGRCRDVLVSWCNWREVQPADAEDIYQNSMLVVLRKVGEFRHAGRGSFRAWLRAIAWRCWCDAASSGRQIALSDLREKFLTAQDDIAALDEEYERIWQAGLMSDAMQLVQARVNEKTWEMFRRCVLEGEPAAVVSAAVGLPDYAVHSAKSRVQRMIAAEVRRLQQKSGRLEMGGVSEHGTNEDYQ